ncbi:MAG: hypothetical protein IVW51_16650 [Thermaceae bacterium]|nr:hypothetical protein [Thermaceae bacterium]
MLVIRLPITAVQPQRLHRRVEAQAASAPWYLAVTGEGDVVVLMLEGALDTALRCRVELDLPARITRVHQDVPLGARGYTVCG